MNAHHKPPRTWVAVAIGARVLIITVLATLLSFALGLFLGIVGVALANSAGLAHASMAAAYRNVAFPAAVIGMIAALIGMIIMEVREYRRPPLRMAR
ncbi:MAG TPA: hypothetical protein VFU76_17225 [Terriglobales bacterium]|nr:hypothetical protein [Terriglobales bacterium]